MHPKTILHGLIPLKAIMCNGCGTKWRADQVRSPKHCPPDTLVLDGSYGEGGGQILRTALSLAALAGRPLRIDNIRSRRPKPGLAAQHLTAVRAAAEICQANVQGAALGSRSVNFVPTTPVRARDYVFDVSAAREGSSAGAATLVLQTVLLPLAFAKGISHLVVRGGTHMAWSPSYEYVDTVWLPLLYRLGVTATVTLARTGWFPIGRGEITATIDGVERSRLRGLDLRERGRLLRIWGQAIAANLPGHIPLRMVDQARSLLQRFGVDLHLVPVCAIAACPGAGLFLTVEYENMRCGFAALGERGKPSEVVAEEAIALFQRHFDSGAAVDLHLADQILAPLALAAEPSVFSTERATAHLESNAWLIERFGLASIEIEAQPNGTAMIHVTPAP